MFRAEGFSSFFFTLVPFNNVRLLSLSILLAFSSTLAFLSIRLASTLVRQSGNPGIMNSQLSLAIPALPANTTLRVCATSGLAVFWWKVCVGERGREKKKWGKGRELEELYQEKMLTRHITHAEIWFASHRLVKHLRWRSYSIAMITYTLLATTRLVRHDRAREFLKALSLIMPGQSIR